jgi:2-keto-3-deoxy-L-rhamnonate aldolase RhmA
MNAFRHLLMAAGHQPPIGTWISSASPMIAEAMGHAGFDWGVVDMEHAPVDVMEVVQMLQALSATKMVPVVRVPWNDAVTVKRVLDAGATTLMFPFVQDAEEARRAVASTRFPPDGTRGMVAMSRASRYGMQPHYLQTANRHIGVIVQIESAAAVGQLGHIAAVEGVDALLVGPADAVRGAKAAGVPIGTMAFTPDSAARYRAMSFDFLAVAADLHLVMQGAAATLNALRTQDGADHVHTLSGGTRPEPGA